MTKQQFLEAFKSALIGENASPDFVNEQTYLLEGKLAALSDEDFEKRADQENVTLLVRSAMEEYLSRTKHTVTTEKTDEESQKSTVEENDARDGEDDTSDPNYETKIMTDDIIIVGENDISSQETKKLDHIPNASEQQESDSNVSVDNDIVTVDMTPIVTSVKKKDDNIKPSFFAAILRKAENRSSSVIFSILTILFLPLILFTAFASLGALVTLYFALAAIIVAIIGAILIAVLGGGLTSIVALLYGATQIMQEPRYIGIHEIGFALIVIGSTILISVLLYNTAVRLIPWILSKASTIFKWLVSAVKRLADKAKKGCEKL